MASIPAQIFVNTNDSVISAGGSGLEMVGLFFTNNTRAPFNNVLSFPSAAAVGAYFGLSSLEYTLAGYYFAGFDNKDQSPGAMLFTSYAATALAPFLRGGSGLTLTQVKAMSGVLSVTIGGTTYTSGTVSLSGATSFSNAASLIQAGFTSPALPGTVTYDSTAGAFVVTGTATGAAATIAPATGTLAAPLLLTTATGAITSQGAAADTPTSAITRTTNATQNFAGFTTTFDPDGGVGHANKLLFAQWVSQNGGYGYVGWHTDVTATQSGETTALGALLAANNYSGTESIYAPVNGAIMGAVKLGFMASVNHDEANGRVNYAHKTQSGLAADVTDYTSATNLIANGENFYGAYATRSQNFLRYFPGVISGKFDWADAYYDQIWFDDLCQNNLVTLLGTVKLIPNDAYGDAQIKASLLDPVNTASSYGMFQSGVTLSNQQKTELLADAGIDISSALVANGFYILVAPATPAIRAARGPRQVKIYYTDGGAVNTINLTNTLVQ